MEYTAQLGDIFLCDSDRFAAKMVEFLMQSPTVWQQIWRFFRHTLTPTKYYHAGMILDAAKMIEQQGKCQYGETQKILSRRIIILRKKSLTDAQRANLQKVALNDLGKGYGVLSCIGKLFTWLTGIRWFEDVIHWPNDEICINRVCLWYWEATAELFGVHNYRESTTLTVETYCKHYTDEWEIVYEN